MDQCLEEREYPFVELHPTHEGNGHLVAGQA